jgi:hypothetical protein
VYKQHRRLAQPGPGIKDPGEAYAAGINIRQWIVDAMPRGLRIKLGFSSSVKPVQKRAAEPAPQQPAPAPLQTSEATPQIQPGSRVVEVELTNGMIIYITDDQQQWQELTDAGKPVFSRNEMERLKAATSTMDQEERLAAAMQVIEAKQVFGGYLRRGELCRDGEGVEATQGERGCRWTLNRKA